mgnify:CR=1 FL=1
MSRAVVLVLDSLGVGALPDATRFGDAGADTLGHIADWCARPADAGGRGRPLALPNLWRLGLAEAAALARGAPLAGVDATYAPAARWGAAREASTGKDTVSGHWELAGVPVDFEWGYFTAAENSFPPELLATLTARSGVPGFLGNCHASGTEIIARLGAEHIATGKPIVYTSADSVLQICAHEEHFGLERLYALCAIARELVDAYRIGRVIARPFVGHDASDFRRTAHRRDYAVPPVRPTLLDRLDARGSRVTGIGKIPDIFAHRGVNREVKASGIPALMDATLDAFATTGAGGLVFTNLVDFDQEFGHRRDVAGYAAALEDFDARLPALMAAFGADDLLLLAADHGNDPTFRGSDHTREHVPLLAWSPGLAPGPIGLRTTFADAGQSLARWLGLAPLDHGTAFV